MDFLLGFVFGRLVADAKPSPPLALAEQLFLAGLVVAVAVMGTVVMFRAMRRSLS